MAEVMAYVEAALGLGDTDKDAFEKAGFLAAPPALITPTKLLATSRRSVGLEVLSDEPSKQRRTDLWRKKADAFGQQMF